jgi:hypothetical protein
MRGFRTWISGPGFQDLESSPSYGRLIFSLRPVVTDARTQQVTVRRIKMWNCRVRQTHGRTQGRSEFIYKIIISVSGSNSKTHLQLVPSFNPFFTPTISHWFQFRFLKTWILVLVWLWFLKIPRINLDPNLVPK